MERIPEQYQIKDMPVPAVFEADDNKQLGLIPTPGFFDKTTDSWIEEEGKGLRVKFRGFKLWVFNKKIFELVMTSAAFKDGAVRISSGDESGFWRQTGAVKVRKVEVVEPLSTTKLTLADIDLKAIKKQETVEPLVQVT